MEIIQTELQRVTVAEASQLLNLSGVSKAASHLRLFRAPGAGRPMRHSRALGGCARLLAPLAPLELRRGRKPCQLWTHHVPGVNLARGVVLVSDATRLCVLNSKAVVECRSSGGGLSLTAESGRARKRHHAEATPLTAAQPSPRHTSRRRSYLEPRLPWRPLSW